MLRPMFDRRLPPETFRRLIEPHTQALYRLAFRFTGRRADAEDLLQELLTRMYAKSARLANIDLLRPWLARALYNLFVDERRRNARSALGPPGARCGLRPLPGAFIAYPQKSPLDAGFFVACRVALRRCGDFSPLFRSAACRRHRRVRPSLACLSCRPSSSSSS